MITLVSSPKQQLPKDMQNIVSKQIEIATVSKVFLPVPLNKIPQCGPMIRAFDLKIRNHFHSKQMFFHHVRIFQLVAGCSVGPKAEVLRPQPKISDLRLRLRWPKFEAKPTAEVLICSFLSFFPKMEAEMQVFLCFHYTGATCLQIRLIWIISQD